MIYYIVDESDWDKITYTNDGRSGEIVVPKGVSVGTLTAKAGTNVRVDGHLKELTGDPGTVCGDGVISTIRGADCHSIEGSLYVDLIDKSVVKWCVSCLTVEQISGSTIASIDRAVHVNEVSDSRVDLLTGRATVGRVEDSTVLAAYGQSRIDVLSDNAAVTHLAGNAIIMWASAGALVGLADSQSTVRYLTGTVQSARGAALVLCGPGGNVKHMGRAATVVQTGANFDGNTPSHSAAYAHDGDGILAYKATDSSGVSGHQFVHLTEWVPGETVHSHAWSCSANGPGLYLSPTIADAINWCPGSVGDYRFFLCRIKPEDAFFIDEGRVKTPHARVIAEVDGQGRPLEPVD